MSEERDLIHAAQNGSKEAFEGLYRRHWRSAYRAAYLVTHDAAASEDIAQEAFLAAARALGRFDRRRPFAPWLHRIVVNRSIDWTRARQARAEVLVDAPASRPTPQSACRAYCSLRSPRSLPINARWWASLHARVHARRDRRDARPPARHGELPPPAWTGLARNPSGV